MCTLERLHDEHRSRRQADHLRRGRQVHCSAGGGVRLIREGNFTLSNIIILTAVYLHPVACFEHLLHVLSASLFPDRAHPMYFLLYTWGGIKCRSGAHHVCILSSLYELGSSEAIF